MSSAIHSKIGIAFKREGLVLQGKEVMEYVVAQLREHADDPSFLVGLLRGIDRASLHQNYVDVAAARRAVELITMDVAATVEEQSLKVISGLECPRHRYHESRKTFIPFEGKAPLHGTADDQARVYRHRFELIRQRLVRHDLFAQHKLTTVESLLGVTGRKVVFGMLTRDNHGELILEDLNNNVKVDLSAAKIDDAFFTDRCFVLADGELIQGTFHVHVLTMPPVEDPRVTLNTFSNVELFGGAVDASIRDAIAVYQRSAEHVMLVVLADVWLDRPAVMAKLETLFEGFKDIVPTAFVFTGNYMSRPFASTAEDALKLQQSFQGLARLILRYKALALQSQWIFSRGPADGGGPLVFPQFALPDFFVASLKQKLPKVTFTTNPFRLRWCNVRITLFRENLLAKMRRHTLFPHLQQFEQPPHVVLARTLVEQSHLCPLPQAIAPVYWNLDQAMQLYPIPDLLVLADSYDQYVIREDGFTICNPGSFSTDFSFLIVRPATLEVEESRIPSGTSAEAAAAAAAMDETDAAANELLQRDEAPLEGEMPVEVDEAVRGDNDDDDDDDVDDGVGGTANDEVAPTQIVVEDMYDDEENDGGGDGDGGADE